MLKDNNSYNNATNYFTIDVIFCQNNAIIEKHNIQQT